MYSTCVFCHGALGQNQEIEQFPVGRRLAFDAAKGRLWVVCPACERWNLSPLEERWEAIEECERRFRDARKRVSTENIGLARIADGTDLVRIGAPLRPEFAAWRYGDQFGRRRRRRLLGAAAGVSALGAVAAGGAALGLSVGGFWYLLYSFGRDAVFGDPDAVVARLGPAGLADQVRRKDLGTLAVAPGDRPGEWRLRLQVQREWLSVTGPQATKTLETLLPHVNRYGASASLVRSSVQRIEEAGGPEPYLETAMARAVRWARQAGYYQEFQLRDLHTPDRLALEMALHEEAERRALEGELRALAERWQEAEEIAAVADDMFLSDRVLAWFERLRGERRKSS